MNCVLFSLTKKIEKKEDEKTKKEKQNFERKNKNCYFQQHCYKIQERKIELEKKKKKKSFYYI